MLTIFFGLFCNVSYNQILTIITNLIMEKKRTWVNPNELITVKKSKVKQRDYIKTANN